MYEHYDSTVPGVIAEWGRKIPRQPAIIFHGRKSTFGELADRMCSVAGYLIDAGIAPGDRVGVLMPPSDTWAAVHYGVMAAGAIIVPINLSLKADELRFVLSHSRVQYLIVAEQHRDIHLADLVEELVPALTAPGEPQLYSPEFPDLRGAVLVSRKENRRGCWRTAQEMLSFVLTAELSQELDSRLRTMGASDSCAIVYTSGSTSYPKPALLHHRGLLGGAWWYGEGSAMDSSERILVLAPTFHVSGISAGMLVPHIRGYPAWLMEGFDAGQTIETVETERITMFSGFDTMFVGILRHPNFHAGRVASIRSLRLATGPAMYDRVYAAFPNLKHTTKCYAMTETCGPSAITYPHLAGKTVHKYSNGTPIPGVQIRIVDIETGQTLPPNRKGEIRLKGWNLFNGYYGMEKETKEAFDEDDWFKTGDLGYFDEDGYVYLEGRLKRMIKTGGENVSEREVEIFLEDKVPGVSLAQVVGIPDPVWGEAIIAFVEPRLGACLSEGEIRYLCKARLANFKVPKRIFVLSEEQWPRNAVGKISKDILIELGTRLAQSEVA